MKSRESKTHTVRESNKQSNPKGQKMRMQNISKKTKETVFSQTFKSRESENPKGKSTTVLFKRKN